MTYETNADEIRRRYPDWMSVAGNNDTATYAEYWDEEWRAIMVDGSFVEDPEMHGYGFNPCIPSMPMNSIDWDTGTPEKRYQGLLNPVHNLLETEARLATQIESIIRTTAWRTLDFVGPRVMAQQTADEYELFMGKNVIPSGVTVMPSPMSQVPPDLWGQLGAVQGMIEDATFPKVVTGARGGGRSSGFEVSVRAGQGRMRFQGTADGLSRAIEKVNTGFAMIVENKIRGPVTVHARSDVHQFDETIKPEDIKGYYENNVTLKAEAPEEREREAILAERLFRAGLLTKHTAMLRAGVSNPLEEMIGQAAETLAEAARGTQIETLLGEIQGTEIPEIAQAATGQGVGGFEPGIPQLQNVGERNRQGQRMASRDGRPSVFPGGMGPLDQLGRQLGMPGGGAVPMPSGETVR